MLSSISSTFYVASISCICRFDNDVVGGMYILITFIL